MRATTVENIQLCIDLLEPLLPERAVRRVLALDGPSRSAEAPSSWPTDGAFDLITLGHLPSSSTALGGQFRDLTRVLADSGFIVLVLPSEALDHDIATALARDAACHALRDWQDERGPTREHVTIFGKRWAQIPDRPHRVHEPGRAAPRTKDPSQNLWQGGAPYLEVLTQIHDTLKPRTYLEIGVHRGESLRLANCSAVAVDPDPRVTVQPPAILFHETSDDFFRYDAATALPDGMDLAFIDGLHLFENALRDFMHTERLAGPAAAIVIDDVLPNHPSQATRDRQTFAWCGDVWKIVPCLQRHRPDLHLYLLDSSPVGLLLVTGLDPTNRVLWERYNDIVAEYVEEANDDLPAEVIRRRGAVATDDIAVRRKLQALKMARSRDAGGRASTRG